MALGVGLLILRYIFLTAMLAFVVVMLWQMIRHLPLPSEDAAPSQATSQRSRTPAPRPRRIVAALVVHDPGQTDLKPGQAIPLNDKNHIGRAPNNSVVIDDPHVSRAHAFIGRRGAAWILVDKGSANGTFLNGQRISRPVALRHGDVISVGTVTFSFRLVAEE